MAQACDNQRTRQPAQNTEIHDRPWYATDLSRWDGAAALSPGDCDLVMDGKAYRRLTPDYFAWLRSRMQHAQQKHQRGFLPDAVYGQLRDRFNALQDEAVQLFGETTLLAVMESLDLQGYEPPSMQAASRSLPSLQAAQAQDAGEHALTISCVAETTRATRPDPNWPPGLAVGVTVRLHGGREGIVTAIYPAEDELPAGWVALQMTDGQCAQADTRYLTDLDGRRFVPMTYTPYEQRAIALAREEKPEDFDDLEASLPILAFPVPGAWRFEEDPSLDDFLKVNDMREQAHVLGWTDADLFQTSGRFRFPCGQDYGLVCFLRGRTIGEITAETIALLPAQPGGAVLTFTRPHRSPAPEEVSDGTIREAIPECSTTATQAAAGGVTTLRRRSDAVCPVSDHAAGVQPHESAGPAHAGVHAHRHRPSAGHESAKRVPDSQSRQTTSAEHPCLVF